MRVNIQTFIALLATIEMSLLGTMLDLDLTKDDLVPCFEQFFSYGHDGKESQAGHGRDIGWTLRAKQPPEHISEGWIGTSWIVEVTARCTRDGRSFQATHLFLTSLRTTPEALLELVHDRWSIEGWPRSWRGKKSRPTGRSCHLGNQAPPPRRHLHQRRGHHDH